eukprot:TRINITY_DN91691_c0_g1_i1.p1 TRINITY_DN91691_c0_g1~~TRINITY_DN91691_c0_g1_i1.p1  ORF type:complete len:224 (-),score=40.91 TRINITY_DN91691_c0_g1_i1:100-771(-)
MGGPCCVDGRTLGTGKATDNFALVEDGFQIDGVTYFSAEHAYQALKPKSLAHRRKIAALVPKKGESAWDHGMRVWNAGQRQPERPGWHAHDGRVKRRIMYECNKAKLEQCQWMREELFGSGDGQLTHRGSGKYWDQWNPILLMLIREELRPGGDVAKIDELRSQMGLEATEEASGDGAAAACETLVDTENAGARNDVDGDAEENTDLLDGEAVVASPRGYEAA